MNFPAKAQGGFLPAEPCWNGWASNSLPDVSLSREATNILLTSSENCISNFTVEQLIKSTPLRQNGTWSYIFIVYLFLFSEALSWKTSSEHDNNIASAW